MCVTILFVLPVFTHLAGTAINLNRNAVANTVKANLNGKIHP